jgi:hypothetical protein
MTDPLHKLDTITAALVATRHEFYRAKGDRFDDHPLALDCRRLQKEAAAEFGRLNGWKLYKSYFSVECLSRRGMPGRNYLTWNHDAIDHPWCYCTPDRRAAAIVVHLYPLQAALRSGDRERIDNELSKIRQWGAANHVRALFHEIDSWWNPGGCAVVAYEPLMREGMTMSDDEIDAYTRTLLKKHQGKSPAEIAATVCGMKSHLKFASNVTAQFLAECYEAYRDSPSFEYDLHEEKMREDERRERKAMLADLSEIERSVCVHFEHFGFFDTIGVDAQ